MKTFFAVIAVFFIGMVIGFYFRGWYVEDEIREERFQREIGKCDRIIEENDRLLELINYNGDDWMEKWEEYMMEQMLFEGPCPV